MVKKLNELEKITLLGVKKILTTDELSLFTGLSASTLRKLTSARKIPYYKSRGGKINFYDKDEISKWMLSYRVKTSKELDTEALTYMIAKK